MVVFSYNHTNRIPTLLGCVHFGHDFFKSLDQLSFKILLFLPKNPVVDAQKDQHLDYGASKAYEGSLVKDSHRVSFSLVDNASEANFQVVKVHLGHKVDHDARAIEKEHHQDISAHHERDVVLDAVMDRHCKKRAHPYLLVRLHQEESALEYQPNIEDWEELAIH